jgi:hypothetical protein
MISNIASLLCAAITFGMAILQFSLTFGAPFGEYVLGGLHKILPKEMRKVSGTFSILFTLIAIAYLQKGNVIDIGIPLTCINVILIINTLFLAYAIIGNGFLTKSRKERYVMTPLSLIQFLGSLLALLFT